MITFVDLQGFKTDTNEFIVKEVAILKNNELAHYVVKAPFSWKLLSSKKQKEAKWLQYYYHGFNWDDGFVDYVEARKLINKQLQEESNVLKREIYVKGLEKKKWLEEILTYKRKIINIEDIGIQECLIDADDIRFCNNHKWNYKICALNNVYILRELYEKNK